MAADADPRKRQMLLTSLGMKGFCKKSGVICKMLLE